MDRPGYFFIRANGDTLHNNPARPECYIPGEPPTWPRTAFNYADFCLRAGFVRIGWPGTGDLRTLERIPDRTPCYSLDERVRSYLEQFRSIQPGSVVLMPEPDRSGVLFIGEAVSGYCYVGETPFECAHRVHVEWDQRNGEFAEYHASDLGIPIRGGFWLWAFHDLTQCEDRGLIARIEAARGLRNQ